jgi:hypothetical protein
MKRLLLIVCIFSATFLLANTEVKAQADTTFSVTVLTDPFDDQVVINVNHGNKNIVGIRIFDAIGKEVANVDLSASPSPKQGVTSITIDFSHLKPGVYFCTVYSNKGILETKRLYRGAR